MPRVQFDLEEGRPGVHLQSTDGSSSDRGRLTRTRVTRILSLSKLPEAVKGRVTDGGEPRTIRAAIERRYSST